MATKIKVRRRLHDNVSLSMGRYGLVKAETPVPVDEIPAHLDHLFDEAIVEIPDDSGFVQPPIEDPTPAPASTPPSPAPVEPEPALAETPEDAEVAEDGDDAGMDLPWDGYDDDTAVEVRDALKDEDAEGAAYVLEYERAHKNRVTITRAAQERLDELA